MNYPRTREHTQHIISNAIHCHHGGGERRQKVADSGGVCGGCFAFKEASKKTGNTKKNGMLTCLITSAQTGPPTWWLNLRRWGFPAAMVSEHRTHLSPCRTSPWAKTQQPWHPRQNLVVVLGSMTRWCLVVQFPAAFARRKEEENAIPPSPSSCTSLGLGLHCHDSPELVLTWPELGWWRLEQSGEEQSPVESSRQQQSVGRRSSVQGDLPERAASKVGGGRISPSAALGFVWDGVASGRRERKRGGWLISSLFLKFEGFNT